MALFTDTPKSVTSILAEGAYGLLEVALLLDLTTRNHKLSAVDASILRDIVHRAQVLEERYESNPEPSI